MTKEEISNLPGYAGIYVFKNKLNGKCYVGQAIKLKKRIQSHWKACNSSQFEHLVFYRAVRKYGWDNFELTVVETIRDALSERTKQVLDDLEKKYIQEYDSYNNGYNSTLGGDAGVLGYKHTEEMKKHLSELSKKQNAENPKNWIKGKNLETGEEFFAHNATEMAEVSGCHPTSIRKCATGKQKLAKGKWVFAEYDKEYIELPEYDTEEFDSLKSTQYKELSNKAEICEYIKENPKVTYGEIKQIFNLCKKTFYNYKNELGIIGTQRSDCKVTKEEFLEYYKDHSKEECMEHFNIKERLYYKYKKKYDC